MEFWNGIAQRALTLHSDVSLPVVALIASVAGFVVLLPSVWPKARFWVTYIHELGHGTASVFTGGGLRGMKIHGDSSGVAETWRKAGPVGWLTAQFTTWAGYPAPAFASLIMTVSANVGFSSALLLALCLMSLVALLFMRNLRGAGLAILIASLSAGIFWFAPATIHAVLMLSLAGALIAGGFKSVLELQEHHKNGDRGDSDVAALTRSIRPLEAIVFAGYYLIYAVSISASLYFAWLLVQG